MSAPSIRTLAARLNLSRTTVSEALRGSLRVNEETRRRVMDEAASIGYRPNPLASELMTRMRRSGAESFRGLIAIVAAEDDASLPPARRLRRNLLRRHAAHRAGECGFKLDAVCVGSGAAAWGRLPAMLHARNVAGVLLLPSERCRAEHRAVFAAADCPTVYLDAPEEGAEHVDAVAPDYRQALALACGRLAALGFARPGLVLSDASDAAAKLRWIVAAESVKRTGIVAGGAEYPLLQGPPPESARLADWAREQGVDVLLADAEPRADLPVRLLDCGGGDGSAAGLDLRWGEVASRAVDLLARRFFDRALGRVESPALLSLPARWRGEAAAAVEFAAKRKPGAEPKSVDEAAA